MSESDGDIRNVFVKSEKDDVFGDIRNVSVKSQKDDDFEVYFKQHLKDDQADQATQTDESYTTEEQQRAYENRYLRTHMKDVQLTVKIAQPYTRDPFLFYLIHKRIDEGLLLGDQISPVRSEVST